MNELQMEHIYIYIYFLFVFYRSAGLISTLSNMNILVIRMVFKNYGTYFDFLRRAIVDIHDQLSIYISTFVVNSQVACGCDKNPVLIHVPTTHYLHLFALSSSKHSSTYLSVMTMSVCQRCLGCLGASQLTLDGGFAPASVAQFLHTCERGYVEVAWQGSLASNLWRLVWINLISNSKCFSRFSLRIQGFPKLTALSARKR